MAAVGLFFASQDAQQGGLAAAVRPDQADALAGLEAEGDIAEDGGEVVGFGEVVGG